MYQLMSLLQWPDMEISLETTEHILVICIFVGVMALLELSIQFAKRTDHGQLFINPVSVCSFFLLKFSDILLFLKQGFIKQQKMPAVNIGCGRQKPCRMPGAKPSVAIKFQKFYRKTLLKIKNFKYLPKIWLLFCADFVKTCANCKEFYCHFEIPRLGRILRIFSSFSSRHLNFPQNRRSSPNAPVKHPCLTYQWDFRITSLLMK